MFFFYIECIVQIIHHSLSNNTMITNLTNPTSIVFSSEASYMGIGH
jgi:hypothetical protein